MVFPPASHGRRAVDSPETLSKPPDVWAAFLLLFCHRLCNPAVTNYNSAGGSVLATVDRWRNIAFSLLIRVGACFEIGSEKG